jgi:DNA-directed RNA polymerase specialized sigma24 family protein
VVRIVPSRAVDALRGEQREARKVALPVDRRRLDAPTTVTAEIVAAVRGLPLDRRLPLILRYWLGCAPSEIADLLSLPTGTVNSRIAARLR